MSVPTVIHGQTNAIAWQLAKIVRADDTAEARTADAATIATWIVTCPWAHPVWSQYAVSLIHLRTLPGSPAPVLYDPTATHEIAVLALHPQYVHRPETSRTTAIDFHLLTPPNFVGQFAAPHDARALLMAETALQEVLDGKLSPDSDYWRRWQQRFPFTCESCARPATVEAVQ